MYKIKFTIGLLLLFPVIMVAQIFPKEGYDVGSLIPENYILKEVKYGDLNGDNKDDLVIVIRNIKTKNKSAAIYYYDSEYEQYILRSESTNFFLFERGDLYRPDLTTYEVYNDRIKEEEFVLVIIKDKVISINTSDGQGFGIDSKFKKNQIGNYELIGIEMTTYLRGIYQKISINYLTGKMQIKSSSNDENEKIDDEWFKLSNLKKFNFNTFSLKKVKADIVDTEWQKI